MFFENSIGRFNAQTQEQNPCIYIELKFLGWYGTLYRGGGDWCNRRPISHDAALATTLRKRRKRIRLKKLKFQFTKTKDI
jgi:hypothetical protein